MKNKEIEELLKYLKNNTYIPDETNRKYKILHRDEVKSLLSHIEQLENNRDKAIEYIENNYDFYYGDELYDQYVRIINILKGDSDE